MARQVQFEGVTHQFPDDATDDEVRMALEGGAPQAKPSQSWGDIAKQVAMAPVDAAIGAGKGALSTIYHAADPLNRAFGLERKLDRPEVQAAITPSNTTQKIGMGAEQAAEFLAPAGAVGKGAKAIEAATAGVRGAKALNLVGRAGLEAAGSGAVAGAQSGGDPEAMRNAALAAGGTSAGLGALSAALPGIGKGAAEVVGKTTGAGAKPFRAAASNPTPELISQMRNPDEMAVVGNLKTALQDVKDSRASAYSQKLQALSQNTAPIDPVPTQTALANKLQEFRVGKTATGTLDFSASPIGTAGQKDIAAVNDLVTTWKDWSPLGADALKRRIDDLWSESGQARALVNGLKNEVRNSIVAQVPDYAVMTRDYAKASEFLDQLGDLSLGSKNPGTAVRKITTVLNQNNDYRQMLVEALQPYSGIDHSGEIAGLALSKLAPRGIMGPGTGVALVAEIMRGVVSPEAAVALAATSPRLMGELAVAIGKVKPYMGKASGAVTTLAPPMAAAYTSHGIMPPPQRQPAMVPPGQQ